MAERIINQKKHQFLQSFAPVSVSLDALVRKKLEWGKFPFTKTAIVKIIALIIEVAAIALFLAQSWDSCKDKPDWFTGVFLGCVCSSIFVKLFFYLIFSCGGTVKNPGKWVTADIIFNFIFGIVGIIGSVMATVTKINCTVNSNLHSIPATLGIVGGVLTVISCASIFLLYRYVKEEDNDDVQPTPQAERDLRKSIFA